MEMFTVNGGFRDFTTKIQGQPTMLGNFIVTYWENPPKTTAESSPSETRGSRLFFFTGENVHHKCGNELRNLYIYICIYSIYIQYIYTYTYTYNISVYISHHIPLYLHQIVLPSPQLTPTLPEAWKTSFHQKNGTMFRG